MYYIIYGFLWLISLLPFRVLYLLSDAIYGLVFYIIKYRKEIVMNNLLIAFPEKTEKERLKIAKQFYLNFVDTFIESIKFITLSKKQIQKRASENFHIVNELTDKGHCVHIMAAHQFNWEFGNSIAAISLTAPWVGVYMPIANKSLNKIFYNFRKRYGAILIAATDFKNKRHEVMPPLYAIGLAADQNPGDPSKAYWVDFFNKPTPFVSGPAISAVRQNTAVVMIAFKKIKRGYYDFYCKLLAIEAAKFSPEQLTVMYKKEVEQIIKEDPANYLWSHRRWKYNWKEEYGPIIQ